MFCNFFNNLFKALFDFVDESLFISEYVVVEYDSTGKEIKD